MELVVISDLHLSVGYDEKTGRYSRNEDFFFDEEFKRFLEYLQKAKSPKKHLIIAGDLFDFLQVDGHKTKELDEKGGARFEITPKERKFGLGTEEDKTVWKLGVIADGHPVFFQALANFLSKGNRLSIITGNHDIELYWPKVQEALRDRIANLFENTSMTKQQQQQQKKKKESIKAIINFYPWFYYDKSHKAYIEHGNQYDPLNSFQYFLYPHLEPESKKLWIPFGSFFVRYFFNKLEISNPFADNIKPPTKYMRWAWKENKMQFLKTVLSYLPTMIRVFIKGGKLSKAKKELLEEENDKKLDELALKFGPLLENENDKKLDEIAEKFGLLLEKENDKKLEELAQKLRLLLVEREKDEKLDELAQKFGLPSDAVKKIYSLKARPFTRNKLLNILTFSTFTFIIIAIIISIVLFLPLNASLQTSLYSFGLLIVPLIRRLLKIFQKDFFRKNLVKVFVWIQKHLKVPTAKWFLKFLQKDPFEIVLPKIKEHLEYVGIDVQTIVFGHTHDPDIRIVASDCKYFNTGTWTTVFSEEERIIREAKQFTFVRIKKVSGKPQATLHRWNDCLKRHEKLILFEPKP